MENRKRSTSWRSNWRRVLWIAIGALVVLFAAIQLVPVNRTNPPVTAQINWDSPQTDELARRACMDCHSNETTWPWYSRVAPVSWLVYYDVMRGRSELNLSTLGTNASGRNEYPLAQNNDLAFRLGSVLAGEGLEGREGRPPEGFSRGGAPGADPEGGESAGIGEGPEGRPTGGGFRFDGAGRLGERITEVIEEGEMPPDNYLLLHPEARLTSQEREQLLQGLLASLSLSAP